MPEDALEVWLVKPDPVAQELVRQSLEAGCPVGGLFAALEGRSAMPQVGEPILAPFLISEASEPPDELTAAALDAAAHLFAAWGGQIALALTFRALPRTFAAQSIAAALASTGLLRERTALRLLQTLRFVFAVLRPDTMMTIDGRMVLPRLRLTHALAAELLVRRNTGEGMAVAPIGQADQMGTLCGFMFDVPDALLLLDVVWTDAEQLAWGRAWHWIGSRLGIDDALLPEAPMEARALWRRWQDLTQVGDPENGRQLTKALVATVDAALPGLTAPYVADVIDHFLDDAALSARLGLQPISNRNRLGRFERWFDQCMLERAGDGGPDLDELPWRAPWVSGGDDRALRCWRWMAEGLAVAACRRG